ncbi:MAG: orotidine-5'-phosphate decarboxylase [Acidobacteriota bacterium]|nr:orotidine-5'-phosphate decarboxylase [Acidobacteriota bacterium]
MTTDNEQRTTNNLIVALDVSTAETAREIVSELKDLGVAFKIGLQLFTAGGAGFVRELTEAGARIFLDLKFHDIPNTVAAAAVEAARLGVWMFNLHAAGGSEMMERTIASVRETCAHEQLSQPKIIAVTVLTSSNRETLREVGIENEVLPQVVKLAKLTESCGLDGVVASPLEIEAIRESVGNDFLIVTPGIRPEFTIKNDDQKRVLTPADAVRAGADYLVVGRPILQAENRLRAAADVLNEIESVKV